MRIGKETVPNLSNGTVFAARYYVQGRPMSSGGAVFVRPSVCLFVYLPFPLSVTFVYSVETNKHIFNFCRAMLCISAAVAVMRCPSVTFVDHVKTNKHIFGMTENDHITSALLTVVIIIIIIIIIIITSCAARWPPQYAPAPADRRPTCLQI